MTYSSKHRFLFRLIAGQGVLCLDETNKNLRLVFGEEDIDIDTMVSEINMKISPLQQEIMIVTDEWNSNVSLVFISRGHDETTKCQSVFSEQESTFFRSLMHQIMTNDTREITDLAALNLVNDIYGLSKTVAKRSLESWCRMGFLDRNPSNDNYALGVRAICEFEDYLQATMSENIKKCIMCKKIVCRGYNCPACLKAVHRNCLNIYLKKKWNWPCCKIPYDDPHLRQPNSVRSVRNDMHEPTEQQEERSSTESSQIIDNILSDTSDAMDITEI